MKKIIAAIIVFFMLVFFPSGVYAEELTAADYGLDDTDSWMTYDASEFLRENNITPDDPSGALELSPKTVLSYMINKLKNSAAAPIKLLGVIISTIIMSAAAGTVSDTVSGNKAVAVFRIVTVLAAVTVIVPPLESCFQYASQTMTDGGNFMICYVPVFAGICTASGNPASSSAYSAFMLMTAEASVNAVSEILMPAVSVCMAMSIIDCMNPMFSLSSVTALIKKMISAFLGFIMTIFTGMLSVQSIVGVSADTVGVKAAKFVVSNVVPVIGSAVADAYSSMRAGLGLLRGAAGAFGIIALAVTVLPPVIQAGCMYIAMSVGAAAAEMFGAGGLSSLFKGAASALSLVMAVLACFIVMFVISTVILMSSGLNCMV